MFPLVLPRNLFALAHSLTLLGVGRTFTISPGDLC